MASPPDCDGPDAGGRPLQWRHRRMRGPPGRMVARGSSWYPRVAGPPVRDVVAGCQTCNSGLRAPKPAIAPPLLPARPDSRAERHWAEGVVAVAFSGSVGHERVDSTGGRESGHRPPAERFRRAGPAVFSAADRFVVRPPPVMPVLFGWGVSFACVPGCAPVGGAGRAELESGTVHVYALVSHRVRQTAAPVRARRRWWVWSCSIFRGR